MLLKIFILGTGMLNMKDVADKTIHILLLGQ